MYPIMVGLLVEYQRSMAVIREITPFNASQSAGSVASEARSATSEYLPFTVAPVYSTTDDEAESQRSHGALQSQDSISLEITRIKETQLVQIVSVRSKFTMGLSKLLTGVYYRRNGCTETG